jgi:branched-chain amino acid transport system permease protein
MVLAIAGVLLVAAPAAAQDGESIQGTLSQRIDGERVAVPGVTLRVYLDGSLLAEVASRDDGSWEVTVPGPGLYSVEIDSGSLPEGIALRDPERTRLDDVEVREGQAKTVLFALGPGAESGRSGFDRFVNLLAKGLVLGSIVAIATIGLSLIFGITGLVNFAHGELVTFGAIVAWFFSTASVGPGLPLLVAVVPTLVLAGGLGFALERGIFRPLRDRRVGNISLIVVSIGLSLFLRHIYLVLFGGAPRPFSEYAIQEQVALGPIELPPKDIVIVLISLAVLGLVGLLFLKTRIGTAMRAVADNKDLAESSGIDVRRVILFTWVLGTALASLGGILLGVTETIQWDMGFSLLLIMFAAVVLGGLGTAFGAMAGGLIIGVVTETSTFWLPVDFKVATALAALILVLLVRPQGIFGIKERVG